MGSLGQREPSDCTCGLSGCYSDWAIGPRVDRQLSVHLVFCVVVRYVLDVTSPSLTHTHIHTPAISSLDVRVTGLAPTTAITVIKS